jgi:hypothetical protein
MAVRRQPTRTVLIDGEMLVLLSVEKWDEGMGEIEVVDPSDDVERTYVVFDTSQRAGELARESIRSELLHGLDSRDADERRRAVKYIVEYVGGENLIYWALGQPAGPGTVQVRSLEAWFDLYEDRPAEHWNRVDNETEAEIEADEDDYTEAKILLGESAWDDILTTLGFAPTVAYQRE